mgnify:CR=1 FL=1
MSNVQTNVRVPQDSRDLIQDIATRLRNEDGFAEKLRSWLESEQDGAGADVHAVLAELRARVEALEGARPVPELETRQGADGPFTYKSGSRTFLTKAGEAKIRELHDANTTAHDIAKVVGISSTGVRYQLNKMGYNDRNY